MLRHLGNNHDNEGAAAPLITTINSALGFIDTMENWPSFNATLNDEGCAVIEFEDRSAGLFADITFRADGFVECYCRTRNAPSEFFEGTIPKRYHFCPSMSDWFSDKIAEPLIAIAARLRRAIRLESEQCKKCKEQFSGNEDNKKLADLLEHNCAECACEKQTVGARSPGRITNSEKLLRIIISPRDYDPVTKTIFNAPFEKAFANGVSVCRDRATDEHIVDLTAEGLTSQQGNPPKTVQLICAASAAAIEISAIITALGPFAFMIKLFRASTQQKHRCRPMQVYF